jgi:thiol-disulfide isomerase/thioredoxin
LLIIAFLLPFKAMATPAQIIKDLNFHQLDQAAPEIHFRDDAGKINLLAPIRDNFILLHLWATWCVPCQKEMPALIRFAGRLKDAKIDLVLISVDDEEKRVDVHSILKELKIERPPLLLIKDQESKRYYGWGIPMTYLINPHGKIVARGAGMRDWDKTSVEKFKELLESPAPKKEKSAKD